MRISVRCGGGKAESIPIKTGITDGRYTEVSGEGLSEGMEVILRTTTPAT
jgi:HlyD family secretion protein